MPGNVKFSIEGAAEMDRLLKELGPRVASRVGDQALRAGGRVVVEKAKQRAPVEEGDLRDDIGMEIVRRPGDDATRELKVGVGGRSRRKAHLVEFGTAPHTIRAKNAQVLATPDGVLGREVEHPGAAPHPFLTPALDEGAAEALDKIGETLGKGIEREAKKLAKPGRRR